MMRVPRSVTLALLLTVLISSAARAQGGSGSLIHDGQTRTFQYIKPPGCCDGRPLVFVLHGGGGNADNVNDPQWDGQWGLVAESKNFMVVFPEGKPEAGNPSAHWWNDCRSDESPSEPSYSDWDDVGFITALIDWAVLNHGIDASRVYVTGASNGGQMTLRMGLEAGDRIAAIAPHVAQMAKHSECGAASGSVPAYIHYGTSDPLSNPNGGCLSVPGGGCARGEVISIFDTIAFWKTKNAAFTLTNNVTIDPFPSDGVSLTQQSFQASLSQNPANDHVVFVQAANNGGHWVPGPDPISAPAQVLKGLKSRDINSAEQVYAFFERFSNGCPDSPRVCREAQKSTLQLESGLQGGNRLAWSWVRGESTTQNDLADPTAAADYAFCLYAGTAATLVAEAAVPANASKWSPIGSKGYKYLDKAMVESGVKKVLLKAGAEAKAKAQVKGEGNNLPDPALPLALPVIAQLVNRYSDVCMEATYTAADIKKNDVGQFKAKARSSP